MSRTLSPIARVLSMVAMIAVFAAAVALYFTTRGPSSPEPGPDWDFFGVVERVETPQPLAPAARRTLGGEKSWIDMGPLTLLFRNGDVVDVPAGTSGGNWCELLSGHDGKRECVVGGVYNEAGIVEWFELLDPEQGRPRDGGRRTATTIGAQSEDEDNVLVRGISIPKHPDYRVFCSSAATVQDVLDIGLPATATIDIETESVIVVSCIAND